MVLTRVLMMVTLDHCELPSCSMQYGSALECRWLVSWEPGPYACTTLQVVWWFLGVCADNTGRFVPRWTKDLS
jgi:hypothetical protein